MGPYPSPGNSGRRPLARGGALIVRRWIVSPLVGLAALGLALWGLLVVSLRTRFRPVLDRVRRLNRALWNPLVMRAAGTPGADASIVRHVRRRTGTPYETPVGAVATENGFAIGLPYGTAPDWVENVVAAGSAVVVHEGSTYPVDGPEVVDTRRAGRYFTAKERRIQRLYGVRDFLLLRRVESRVELGRRP